MLGLYRAIFVSRASLFNHALASARRCRYILGMAPGRSPRLRRVTNDEYATRVAAFDGSAEAFRSALALARHYIGGIAPLARFCRVPYGTMRDWIDERRTPPEFVRWLLVERLAWLRGERIRLRFQRIVRRRDARARRAAAAQERRAAARGIPNFSTGV